MAKYFEPLVWNLAHGRHLVLGPVGHVMAVLNVTPDSFSDGGEVGSVEDAVSRALQAYADGASIVDIGGESTKPGANPVSAGQEQDRILPVIEALRTRSDGLISVDTYRAETALFAIAAGAHIINDVHGLQKEPDIARVAAQTGAGLVIMHTGRERPTLADPIADQRLFFGKSLEIAASARIDLSHIVLDPGFGFAKETAAENLVLMARFGELHDLGLPILAGTSRKRFLGAVTGRDARDRDPATAATTVLLRMAGAGLFRVHNVAMNRDALRMADAMIDARKEQTGKMQ
jgi:dihydropteroate synthase